jgi:hypothetical protein
LRQHLLSTNMSNKILFVLFFVSFFIKGFTQTTQLNSATCGMSCTTWFGDGTGNLKANTITGATHYRFWAKGIGVNANYSSIKIRTGLDWIQVGLFSGMKDTTWYEIYVAVSLDNGVTYGPYGPACQVKTPLSQPTQLQSAFCGIQTTSSTQLLSYDTRPYVTLYRIRLKNQLGSSFYDQSITRSVNNFSLSMFSNIQAGKTYECTIQWNNGGDWKPWGQMCLITSPQLPLTLPQLPDRSVFGSAGRSVRYQSTVSTEQRYISCTVGEPITETYGDSTWARIITQGFQQPDNYKPVLVSSGTSVTGLAPNLNFTAFPNPFSDKIMLVAPEDYKAKAIIKVISLTGQLVGEYDMMDANLEIDLSEFAPGRYYINVFDETGTVLDNLQVVKSNIE